MHRIPAVDRRILTYGVQALNQGEPITLTSIRYAVLAGGARTSRTTRWSTTPVVDEEVSLTVAGIEADTAAATAGEIVLGRGTYRLFLRATDNPESVTEYVDDIVIE